MLVVGNPPVRRLAEWERTTLCDLADEYGTPLYVADLDRVRENYRRFTAAFPDARVLYAAKANTLGHVLSVLCAEGSGVECASAGEVERALAAGFGSDAIHYTAVNPPAVDLDYVVGIAEEHPALTITAGARDTVHRLDERGYDGRLCIRINPGVGAGHHEHVATGADAKFGVPSDRAAAIVEEATARGFDVVGIHAHAGSGIASAGDLAAHRTLVERMGDLARSLEVTLEYVDVGGGFGVPYRPDEEPLDLAAVAESTREALGEVDADLVVEPGRYLVADAGVLLTRVNTVKPIEKTAIVGVDAGMTTLLRPALYGAYHDIRTVTAGADDRPERRITVTGPVCESADVLGTDRLLVELERGDVLAVGNAGAYGYEMASQYNSRPRPATVALDDDRRILARRRETVADIVASETETDR